ncbi:unnamed protein product [Vitrella brassicaformis CCMP3155]|uniref:Uncharacterized protein n=2 Tax=Vitrella brassicaformis TaxID=1169539 RepID=A0A0G4G4G0_VITBC|nr:unnamed protein product [Vitrella brassicaformis CCMP3155]|eukprot:CEM22826.1 unnamed protein product [Vitrella brassicaformis CCMP3155]
MPEDVRYLARYYGLVEIQTSNPILLSFDKRGVCRIDVYFTTGTVSTSLQHPTKGATQLHRRNCTLRDLELIFDDPRKHIGGPGGPNGYHVRDSRNLHEQWDRNRQGISRWSGNNNGRWANNDMLSYF